MATTDTPRTFTELQTALLNVLREPTTTTAIVTLAGRYLNEALTALHRERWWWAEREGRLELHASYTTGTVDLALAARTTVTGTDTLWNTAVTGMGFNNVRAGGKLLFSGATHVYPVSSVAGDTSLTLGEPFIGTAALDDATYTYYEDEYALPDDFDDENGIKDALSFPAERKIQVISPQEFFTEFPRNSVPAMQVRVATLIHKGPSGSTARRPRVVFAPPPSIQDSLPFKYYTSSLAVSAAGVGAENLSAATDEPIVPLRWRYALVLKAAELWMLDRKADARAGEYQARLGELIRLARSSSDLSKDRPSIQPRTLYHRRFGSGWQTGPRRFSTGTEFEDMRI